MNTAAAITTPTTSQSPFRRALQSDLDAAFAAAFARLRRAAVILASQQKRDPRSGKLIGPFTALARLAIAANEVTDVCRDWTLFAGFGILPPVDQMGERDYQFVLTAMQFVRATRALRDGKPVERDVINRKHDELIEAALAVGRE